MTLRRLPQRATFKHLEFFSFPFCWGITLKAREGCQNSQTITSKEYKNIAFFTTTVNIATLKNELNHKGSE